MDRPATIEEVATRAGVSRSTVSRVVNGASRVSPAAQAAVERAIAELQYVPNRAARSLASRQARAIALVVPEDTSRFFGDPFFGAIVAGINDRLSLSDYVLNLLIVSNDPGDKATAYIAGGNVDGVLVVSHHTDDMYLDRISAAVPVVFGGRPPREHPDDVFVDVDNRDGARIATEYLLSRGHRRIGTIAGPLNMSAGVDRLGGFRDALAAAGIGPGPVEEADFTALGGEQAMRRIIAAVEAGETEWPQALFVASDLMALGAMDVLREAGKKVPRDIAIVGFDDSSMALIARPQLTTIRQRSRDQGALMVEVLLRRLAGETTERVTMLATELVVRDSA